MSLKPIIPTVLRKKPRQVQKTDFVIDVRCSIPRHATCRQIGLYGLPTELTHCLPELLFDIAEKQLNYPPSSLIYIRSCAKGSKKACWAKDINGDTLMHRLTNGNRRQQISFSSRSERGNTFCTVIFHRHCLRHKNCKLRRWWWPQVEPLRSLWNKSHQSPFLQKKIG